MMTEAVEKGIFKGVQLPGRGPLLSTFQYADDAVFMGDWTTDNCKNLLRILSCFHLVSGLKINIRKCRIFGVGVNQRAVTDMATRLGCEGASLPFVFLGMPIGGSMKKLIRWQPLIDKSAQKLSNWKSNIMSIGGRSVLCKTVLGALGSYLFSLYKAPIAVIKTLESLRRRFFWGQKENGRKIAWVAWKNVLNIQNKGGLNIGSLKAANLALLCKWWWRFKAGPESLWKEVIKALYGDNGGLGNALPNHRRMCTWGVICNLDRDLAKVGIDINRLLLFDSDRNCWNWELEADGVFSVRSLRNEIDSTTIDADHTKTLWCKAAPRKVNLFIWRLLRDKLPTRDNLQARGVIIPSTLCPACNCHPESVEHLFLRCSTTKMLMAKLTTWCPSMPKLDDCTNVASMFYGGSNFGNSLAKMNKFEVILRAFLWTIWCKRNNLVFRSSISIINSLVFEVKSNSYLWTKFRSKFGKDVTRKNWM